MNHYDCIVIGGGHAGVEAALAASRMGAPTLMVTFSTSTIGQMSCNPAIGGVGKGQLVKEIDALGGEMGLAADRTGIQFRQLNASKGAAVRSSRCQSDRKRYKEYMQDVVRRQEHLDVLEDEADEILVRGGKVTGVRTRKTGKIAAVSVIVTSGTYLDGRMHVGPAITPGGRIGEPASSCLPKSLRDLGFEVMMFKTGTPPRLDGATIDYGALETQHSDDPPVPFSFRTPGIPPDQKLLPCHLTATNATTHRIIEANMHFSPMYSGQINATGVRYCPSIEDKLKKFGGKASHQVFLEPEGLDTDEVYPNGISTGLPADVQEAMVRSIKGLEHVKINRYGYSIEHGVIPATDLTASLQAKRIKGLFFAGQVNGTTGYEEAGAQGLLAGINAVLTKRGEAPFILGRDEAYTGVLLDDLVTKGTEEPYRMFTSRVEYRLIVREDNADRRMADYGRRFGLLDEKTYAAVQSKYERARERIAYLRSSRAAPGSAIDRELVRRKSSPLRQPVLLSDILKRPEADHAMIAALDENAAAPEVTPPVAAQVEYEIKYEGFISRQLKDVERFRHIEKIRVPEGIDYDKIQGLSIEIRQKLKRFAPATLGQAHRISGVTPAAVGVLMVYLKKYNSQ